MGQGRGHEGAGTVLFKESLWGSLFSSSTPGTSRSLLMVAVAAPMARAARAAHPRSAPPSATYDPSSPTHRPSPRALAAPLGRALGVLTLALGNLCAGGHGLLRLGGRGEVGGLRMESPAAIAAPVPNLSAAKRAKKMFKAKLNKVFVAPELNQRAQSPAQSLSSSPAQSPSSSAPQSTRQSPTPIAQANHLPKHLSNHLPNHLPQSPTPITYPHHLS